MLSIEMIELGSHEGVEQGYKMVDMMIMTMWKSSTLEKK